MSPKAPKALRIQKKTKKKQPAVPLVLAYDLGGTKVSVGVVNAYGEVVEETREPVLFEHGKKVVIDQLAQLGRSYLKRYPSIRKVGIASAGPLDPEQGMLLDPANFIDSKGRTWGKVPIASHLKELLRRPVRLDNDAAAAMLAEHWVGAARGYQNAMVLTLGTGLGTGIICNGALVRAGHMLHPEAGHMIIRTDDPTAVCGCGNFGCAEAFLSGNGFARRARLAFRDPSISALDVATRARNGDAKAKACFAEYADLMAAAIRSYIVIYAPEIVVLTGSFANASDLFLEATEKKLETMMVRRRVGIDLMPKLALSQLSNQAGLIGGGYIGFGQRPNP